MADYNHIEISRNEPVNKYRFHANRSAPRPPLRDNATYGKKLKNEFEETLLKINEQRAKLGISPDGLLVLEINSESLSTDVLDNMLNKFGISLVEEVQFQEDRNKSKLLLQFADKKMLDMFNAEADLWRISSNEKAVLTPSQRDNLFRCINSIRKVSREDRTGSKLSAVLNSCIPEGFFIVDIDVWYNGDKKNISKTEAEIRAALGTQGSMLLGDLFETSSLLLGRAKINIFSLNSLLDLDIIATVDLPLSGMSMENNEIYSYKKQPIINNKLDFDTPLAAILDTGVFTSNPLLKGVLVGEEEFDHNENTPSDLHSHGTGVAGIVVYGNFEDSLKSNIFVPLVRICSAKIMHNKNEQPCFPITKRPEQITKEAIEFFYKKYGCRIFNLSAGNDDEIYNGGRQFAWAEMLDQLSKNLDIVIIVSSGNVSNPQIDNFSIRDELMEKCRNQLFSPDHRLINPATSALSITVGSITRRTNPEIRERRVVRLSAGIKDAPSVFTRVGRGVNGAIKPEFVDYGGNFSITQAPRGPSNNRWIKNDRNLMEISLHNQPDQIFKGFCGTSFAAPHVTNIAARIERSLERQINRKPSANLIRAFLANAAKITNEMKTWTENSVDQWYTGKVNEKQNKRLRLIGYGKTDDSLLFSHDNQVTLFAEDFLELRSYHIYKIPVPIDFLKIKTAKSISISLAYNPFTRLSRKDYLTNNLWFEVFTKIDEETLIKYKSKQETKQDKDNDIGNMPNAQKANFFPGYTEILKSTLQQRIWSKGKSGGNDLIWDGHDSNIYILVTGKERFKYAEQEEPQNYALVVTFSYSGPENIELYNMLKTKVHIKERDKNISIKKRERTRPR